MQPHKQEYPEVQLEAEPPDFAELVRFMHFAQVPCPTVSVLKGVLAKGTALQFTRPIIQNAYGYRGAAGWSYNSALWFDDCFPKRMIVVFTCNNKANGEKHV